MSRFAILVASLSLLGCINAQSEGEKLRFKLSATNLPNMDWDGPSDPYVVFFAATQRPLMDRHRHWTYIGTTVAKTDTLNPVWDEVFSYHYINGTYQTWRFFVRDQDESWINPIFAIDEFLGHVDVNVEEYVVQLRKARAEQQRSNGTNPIKAIQTFLAHPTGGTVLIHPLSDDE